MNGIEVKEIALPAHACDRGAIADAAAAAYEARVRLYRAQRDVEAIQSALTDAQANVKEPAQMKFNTAMSRLRMLLDKVADDAHVTLQD